MSTEDTSPDRAPEPVTGETLNRYGLGDAKPPYPINVLQADGYWTPWHIAQQQIDSLTAIQEGTRQVWQEERERLEAVIAHQEQAIATLRARVSELAQEIEDRDRRRM